MVFFEHRMFRSTPRRGDYGRRGRTCTGALRRLGDRGSKQQQITLENRGELAGMAKSREANRQRETNRTTWAGRHQMGEL